MKKVIAEISARHLHISQKDLAKLFGASYKLKPIKDLSQPGEFASSAMVDLIGPKNKMAKVRIVGPVRPKTQVELSATDARYLGINPVFRVSGDTSGTPGGLVVKGPKAKINLTSGVIVALRHLHLPTDQAKAWGLKTGDIVRAVVRGPRSLVFDGIVVRVGNYQTRIHLDTDEGNAAGLLSCSKIDLDI